jgi:hypothetical protein
MDSIIYVILIRLSDCECLESRRYFTYKAAFEDIPVILSSYEEGTVSATITLSSCYKSLK